ncbi:MAG: biotin-independent malonate decarboxylase subunit gamma [Burkholderiales bacterium]|nr:biotin-independent malonate decarboxylase subunit gamma [Burkholderiales bacterium]
MSEASSTERLIGKIFSDAVKLDIDGELVTGEGRFEGTAVSIIGTLNQAAIGADDALVLAAAILEVIRDKPRRPILIIADTSGHRLSRWDELVGISGCIAHLTKCIYVARQRGHRVVSLVNELAVSAAFMALGMSSDECYALPQTELRVMAAPAMARITKIPLDRLTELFRSSPVIGPGAENFLRIGALRAIWNENLANHFRRALSEPVQAADYTRVLGEERGGRKEARPVAALFRSEAPAGGK